MEDVLEKIKKEVIDRDKKLVQEKEASFDQNSPDQTSGEILEAVKTLAFNQEWFGGRLVAVRTTKYDDYFNGVDQLILDTETQEVIAAVDTTTNPRKKAQELYRKISTGGNVRYGVGLNKENKVEKRSYSGSQTLPIFIISIDKLSLDNLSNDFSDQKFSESSKQLGNKKILPSLREQSKIFSKDSKVVESLRAAYARTEKIFDDILKTE